jgi:hypothetical protein
VEEEAKIVARTLERGEGNDWEQRPVALLCGGSMLSTERNWIGRWRGHLPPKRRYKDIKLNVLKPQYTTVLEHSNALPFFSSSGGHNEIWVG